MDETCETFQLDLRSVSGRKNREHWDVGGWLAARKSTTAAKRTDEYPDWIVHIVQISLVTL